MQQSIYIVFSLFSNEKNIYKNSQFMPKTPTGYKPEVQSENIN